MSYVGYTKVSSETDLQKFIREHSHPGDFFFLRSLHRVSGIVEALPDTLSPEGQMFNTKTELRWKKQRQHYNVLWLGQQAPTDTKIFTAIKRQWQTEDHLVLLHDRRTPQFPNLFRYPRGLKKKIRQRYFRDADTSIVHFVALTLATQ